MKTDDILAIIPARSGSKGILNKNMAMLANLPLMVRAITNARRCPSITRLMVSTDSDHLAEKAREYGADVPFLRPKSLAADDSETIDTFVYCLEKLERDEGYLPDMVLCLQCTSPFTRPLDIESCIALLRQNGAEAVVSVCPVEAHPSKMGFIAQDGRWTHLIGVPRVTCRQKLDPVFRHNGAIYLVRADVLRRCRTWFPDKTWAYCMDKRVSLDIDTQWDLDQARRQVELADLRSVYLNSPE